MKRFIALTAVSLAALTGAASAMTAATDSSIARIERVAPGVDASALSNTEIRSLLNIIGSSDNGEAKPRVQAYLNQTETTFGTNADVYPFPVSER